MFWGLVLEPGKRYSTTVEKSFHVSKAVLDCSSTRSDNEVLSVILETEGSESLLCNLCKQKGILQESLDLNFMQGDRLTFECRGNGRIHLSGYLLPDEDEYPTLGDEEEESEEEEIEESATSYPAKQKKEKRKAELPSNIPSKKSKIQADDEDDDGAGDSDEDEDDSDIDFSGMDEELEDEEMDEDDDDESEEDDDESPKAKQKPQKNEKHNKTPNKQNQQTPKKTPVTNGVAKEQKSNKKTPSGEKTPNAIMTPKHKQVLESGVVIKDLKVGNGPLAVKGKSVTVHYLGKLKENSKVFDKNMKGEGFKFKLGKGDVIKGWEIGVQGMKVGGKRIIHCPPETAYGAKGAPPKVPGNSSLIFEVELKSVN